MKKDKQSKKQERVAKGSALQLRDGVSQVRRAGRLFVLALLFSLGVSFAQTIDSAAAFSPWPPPGWPEGAAGELRVVALGEGDAFIDLAAFPIEEGGRVRVKLEPGLPRAAREALPFDPDVMTFCDTVLPTLSPGDARLVHAYPFLYANGEPWGLVTSDLDKSTGLFSVELSQLGGVIYADRESLVGGGGTCVTDEGSMEVRYELDLQEGPNLLVMTATGSLAGGTAAVTSGSLPPGPLGVEPGTREELADFLRN